MSRVGLVYHAYLPVIGGVQKSLYEIAQHLTAKGNNVFVITNAIDQNTCAATGSWYAQSPELPFSSKSREGIIIRFKIPSALQGLSFVRRSIGYPLPYSVYMSRVVAQSTKRYDLDTLYAVEPALSSLVLASRQNRKLRTRIRKVGGIRSSFYPSNTLEHYFARKVLRRLDAVIVSMINTKTYSYVKTLTNGKATFIPSWVDTTRFKPRNKAVARTMLGFKPDVQLILSVGRLTADKGFERLMISFGKAREFLDRDATLLIVGSGPMKPALEKLIGLHGLNQNVQLRDDFVFTDSLLHQVYNAADLFALMPFHDGVGNVTLEAMASGLPVVYSKVEGVPRLLQSSLHLIENHGSREAAKIIASAIGASKKERNANTSLVRRHFSKERLLPKFIHTLLGS